MRRDYRSRGPKASRVFDQRFDLQGATALGGLNHLSRFLVKQKLEQRLAARFGDAKARWSTWQLDRVIRVLLDGYFAGIERLYHFEDLETEPLLCARHGVDRLPDLNMFYRDLRRFEDQELLKALFDLLREIVVEALRKQPLVTLGPDYRGCARPDGLRRAGRRARGGERAAVSLRAALARKARCPATADRAH